MNSPLHLVPKKDKQAALDRILAPVAAELQAVRHLYRDYLLNQVDGTAARAGSESGSTGVPNTVAQITALCESSDEASARIVQDVARHLLQRDGKWVRAALVELTAKMFGRTGEDTRATAAAVELIHVATLIHDDLVDSAEFRRGQKSVPANWGVSLSVLMGDFIYAKAFALLSELDSPEAIRAIARSTREVALGEIQEMRFFGNDPVNRAEYERMIHNKTASLFGACAEAGAHLAWMDTTTAHACRDAAVALGMAFQIADDVLDLSGTEADLGKDIDADYKNGKVTLPLLLLREIEPDLFTGEELPDVETLHARLAEHGCLEEARQAAYEQADKARAGFESVQGHVRDKACQQSLLDLCDFVVQRQH